MSEKIDKIEEKIRKANKSKEEIDKKIEELKLELIDIKFKKLLKDRIKGNKKEEYIKVLKKMEIGMSSFKYSRTKSTYSDAEGVASYQDKENNNDDNESYFYDISWTIEIDNLKLESKCNSIISEVSELDSYSDCYLNGIKISSDELIQYHLNYDGLYDLENKNNFYNISKKVDSNFWKICKKSKLKEKYKISTKNLQKIICTVNELYIGIIFENFEFDVLSSILRGR